MKKNVRMLIGCLCLSAMATTGCGAFKKLENPYVYAERTALYDPLGSSQKAQLFAENLCVVTSQVPGNDERITSEAAALFDITSHQALFSKNAFERLYPASVTKVMTALLAVKYGTLSDEVTVTQDAVITESGATLCGIEPGDRLTMEQLLYGLMLPSGNDAGVAIAVHMDKSVEAFADRMNREAKSLGATATHFINPHGLNDEEHYTTAYDLYLIFQEGLKYPDFEKVISAVSYDAVYKNASGETVEKTWKNSNQYLTGDQKMPEGLSAPGGKTGTTKAAGNCLIMKSQDSQGKKYISIILKADGRPALYSNMTNILKKIAD